MTGDPSQRPDRDRKPDLDQRLAYLEDIHRIKELKSLYCYHANVTPGHIGNIAELAMLFTEDAVYDTGFGAAVGPREIETAMRSRRSSPPFSEWVLTATHMAVNPVITVDGDQASGTWIGICPLTLRDHDLPVWYCVTYDDTYIRTPQGWLFQSVRTKPIVQPPDRSKTSPK